MNGEGRIRPAQSCAADARQAAREFHAAVAQPDMSLVIFFCSSDYDLRAMADELRQLFSDVPLVGCTTAGEIGPSGYHQHSLTGASLPAGSCSAVAGVLNSLQEFELGRGQVFTQGLLQELETLAPDADKDNTFALLFIDGLSKREEPVTHTLQTALGDIPLIGGSAGDDLKFDRTLVFHGGRFHDDSAVLILVRTRYPFKIFKTQHFVCDEERLVVTDADAPRRIVKEINGLPAAEEYARLTGARVEDLNPARFAASPVVVMIDGTDYVRSIQQVNPDRSLTFYCAIEVGLVLRVASGSNLIADLETALAEVGSVVGPPQAVFAFDCILRNLEVSQNGTKEKVSDVLRRYNVTGFSTYGEQYGGVHVNQTLTGIAIGS